MVKISQLTALQVAEEVWKYPTSLIPRRYDALENVGLLFFKKAITLGNDATPGGGSVTHEQRDDTEPMYSLFSTAAILNDYASSWGRHNISCIDRLPVGQVVTRKAFECRARLVQTADCCLQVGFSHMASKEPAIESAQIFYDSAVSANFEARSYQAAEEQTDTGIAADTSYHTFRVDIEAAQAKFYIDGNLKATHATQVPQTGLPGYVERASVGVWTNAAAAKSMRCAYVAVWAE